MRQYFLDTAAHRNKTKNVIKITTKFESGRFCCKWFEAREPFSKILFVTNLPIQSYTSVMTVVSGRVT